MLGVSKNAQGIEELPQLPRDFWKWLGIPGNALFPQFPTTYIHSSFIQYIHKNVTFYALFFF